MSTRVRYLMKYSGVFYCGSQIKAVLSQYNPPVNTLAEMKAVAAKIGATLWAFREPRKVSKARSQYKTICLVYGLGNRKFKIKLPQYQAAPAPMEGAQNVGQQGPPAQAGQVGGFTSHTGAGLADLSQTQATIYWG